MPAGPHPRRTPSDHTSERTWATSRPSRRVHTCRLDPQPPRTNTEPPPPVAELGFECRRTMSDPVPPLPTVFKSGGRDLESDVARLSCGECVMSLCPI